MNRTTLTTLKNFTAKIQASSVKNDLMNDVLRGFKADYLSNGTGFNTSVDGLYRISMPRMGCWAFPVSLEEDAFLGAFYDYSERSDRSAFGYYVSRATQWTIYGLGVVTSVGQSFSNGESTPFVTLEAGYSF